MKFRQCTQKENDQLIEMINSYQHKQDLVMAIGYDILKKMYADYLLNFKPSVLKWKPYSEDKFFDKVYTYVARPKLVDNQKVISSRIYMYPRENKIINSRFKTDISVLDIQIINFGSGIYCSGITNLDKWMSRVLMWGEQPFTFTTDEDLTFYEELVHHTNLMEEYINAYSTVDIFA